MATGPGRCHAFIGSRGAVSSALAGTDRGAATGDSTQGDKPHPRIPTETEWKTVSGTGSQQCWPDPAAPWAQKQVLTKCYSRVFETLLRYTLRMGQMSLEFSMGSTVQNRRRDHSPQALISGTHHQ